jgi:hypothetical protein
MDKRFGGFFCKQASMPEQWWSCLKIVGCLQLTEEEREGEAVGTRASRGIRQMSTDLSPQTRRKIILANLCGF